MSADETFTSRLAIYATIPKIMMSHTWKSEYSSGSEMPTSSAAQTQQRVAGAILEAAARTLAAQGPSASMSDVAAAAGVARATVYRYFPARQMLLDELAQVALREIDERLGSARVHEVPTQEAISRVVRALVEVGDAFVVLAQQRGRHAEFERTLGAPLARLFERAQAGGDIREDLAGSWLVGALVGVALSVLGAA